MRKGYGFHGDFISGWDQGFLQEALNICTNGSGEISDCPLFNIDVVAEARSVQTFNPPDIVRAEQCAGPRDGLCGFTGSENEAVLPMGVKPDPTTLVQQTRTAAATVTVTDWATEVLDTTQTVTAYAKRTTVPFAGRPH